MLVDVINLVGETAPHHAAIFNGIEIAKQFLQVEAGADKQNNRGDTSRQEEAQCYSLEVAKLLVDKESNTTCFHGW